MEVLPFVGVAVVALLLYDIFWTVFGEGGGPLHRGYSTLTWRTLHAAVRNAGERTAGRALSLAGPLIAGGTIATWILLLTIGFALVYAPYVLDFDYLGGAPTSRWVEALYFSGVVTSTLGLGDVVAYAPELRLATAAQGLLGLAMFSISTTYILNVYRHVAAARSLALALSAYFEDGVDEALRHEGAEGVLAWSADAAYRLMESLQAYHEYPVLHYFRVHDPTTSLPVQVGHLLQLTERLEEDARRRGEDVPRPPLENLVRTAVHRYVRQTEQGLRPFARPKGSDAPPREAYDRLLRHLGYAGAQGT